MYIKIVWNREDSPEYTMFQCNSYIVTRRERGNPDQSEPYVYIVTQCLDPNSHTDSVVLSGQAEAFVMNEAGKTIDTIRV